MGSLLGWLDANWFNCVQTVSIVIGLIFAGLSFRRDARTRRLSNLLALKQEHRELWSTIHSRPDLARILEAEVDLVAAPVTTEEEVFLRELIVHVATAWELVKDGTPLDLEAFRKDVGTFFRLPIPRWAWERVTHAQSRDFINFFNSAVRSSGRKRAKTTCRQF